MEPIRLLTTEREHLFALSRLLMKAIDSALLQDSQNPVTVSVRGALAGGKKIFPDAAKEAFLEDRGALEGRLEFDEFWTGETEGRPIEIDFINVAWEGDYKKVNPAQDAADRNASWKEVILKSFLKQRKHGGISFIHNYDGFAERADIDICLDQHDNTPATRDTHTIKKAALPALTSKFNSLSQVRWWTRYVEIRINNPRLLKSPAFRTAVESLTLPDAAPLNQTVKSVNQSLAQETVAVFGENIPRSLSP